MSAPNGLLGSVASSVAFATSLARCCHSGVWRVGKVASISNGGRRHPWTFAIEENWPWQLGGLLLALVVANFLVAVFCPDVVISSDVKF
jgi:hypothetical protein